MNYNISNFKINYIYVNNRKKKSYYHEEFIDVDYNLCRNMYKNQINYLKEKIEQLHNFATVDKKNLTTLVDIHFNIKETKEVELQKIIITIVVPLKTIELNTIVETIKLENDIEFKKEIDILFKNINKQLSYKNGKKEDIKKYKYLMLEKESLKTFIMIICQYLQEKYLINNFKFDKENKIVVEMINVYDFKTKKINILNPSIDYFSNLDNVMTNILTISSNDYIEDINIENSNILVVDKILNYSTLINFDTGVVTMNLQVKDLENDNIIYKLQYSNNLDFLLKDFFISKYKLNVFIIPLEGSLIND